ncbi:hypothetical protein Bca4012_070347 [Brassica carinata]
MYLLIITSTRPTPLVPSSNDSLQPTSPVASSPVFNPIIHTPIVHNSKGLQHTSKGQHISRPHRHQWSRHLVYRGTIHPPPLDTRMITTTILPQTRPTPLAPSSNDSPQPTSPAASSRFQPYHSHTDRPQFQRTTTHPGPHISDHSGTKVVTPPLIEEPYILLLWTLR